ncbi:MAG: NfeD family protein [Lachnospiraceae bacterium]|nr:NfeD family protein [Lachnospiraceae bacterium]
MNPVYFWLITMILFIGFELATMGLTTMWFALGALAALAVAAVGGAVWLQVIVFFVVSLLALFGFRNLAKDHFNRNRVKTNADSLIGRKGIVTEEVSNIYATGQVTVAGQEWTARSVDDSVTLEKGEMVVIRSISGVKLMVERIAE